MTRRKQSLSKSISSQNKQESNHRGVRGRQQLRARKSSRAALRSIWKAERLIPKMKVIQRRLRMRAKAGCSLSQKVRKRKSLRGFNLASRYQFLGLA